MSLPLPEPFLGPVALFAELEEDSAGAASAACVLDSEAVWPSEELLPEKRCRGPCRGRLCPWVANERHAQQQKIAILS